MSAGAVTVRRAGVADTDAVVALEAESLGTDAWSPGLVEQGLAGTLPTITYLVAEVAGETGRQVVGHAVASIVADVAELQRIAVTSTHRRRGHAGALLRSVVDLATGAGAERLLLEVREDNAGALAFYDAHGFTELARRPRYYRDGTTAVVLCRSLAEEDS